MQILEFPWSRPVSVRIKSESERTFSSTYEALEFLEHELPVGTGRHHKHALTTCRRALNKETPCAIARQAFISACVEAGLIIIDTSPALPEDDTRQDSKRSAG
jgi:hypothetical protein